MKNSKSGFILPLVIILIALAAISSGVYLYTHNKSEQEINTAVSTSTPNKTIPSPLIETTASTNTEEIKTNKDLSTHITKADTPGWNIYRNSQGDSDVYGLSSYNIEVKFPSNWQIVDQNDDVVIVDIQDNKYIEQQNEKDPINNFLVRTIGDLDQGNLESGELPKDSGWVKSIYYTSGYDRTIYDQNKNLNIIMTAVTTDDEKVDDQILSSLNFSSSAETN